MNSLTLKSEYSEEFSELRKESNLDDSSPILLKDIRKNQEHKAKGESTKHNETLENILNGLNKKDDEPNKNIKVKNLKKIKHKRLKSDDFDELNFSDNKSGIFYISNKMTKPNDMFEQIDEIAIDKESPEKEKDREQSQRLTRVQRKVMSGKDDSSNVPQNSLNLSKTQATQANVKSTNSKNRNFSDVNSHLKDNLVEKKLSSTSSAKVPSFSIHNSKISGSISEHKYEKPKVIEDHRIVLEEEEKDKIEILESFTVKTNIPTNSKNSIDFQHNEMLESVHDGWFIAPMNKIPVRASKHISDCKDLRAKGLKHLHDYFNIKY